MEYLRNIKVFKKIICAFGLILLICGTVLQLIAQTQQQQQKKTEPQKKNADEQVQESEDVLTIESNLTNILFTAVDKDRHFITNLQQNDIKILEDGAPQQIFTFVRQTELPLSIAVLVDTSLSQERTLPEERRAALDFIDQVLRPQKDEAAVVTFTGEVTLEQDLSGNIERVRRAIDRIEIVPPSGYIRGGTTVGTPPISGTNQSLAGSTAVWDAVWTTSEEVLSRTPDKTRRAIILITDGVDTSSQTKRETAMTRTIRADAVIYSIGIGDNFYSGVNEGDLRKISEPTGGRAYFPRNGKELRAAFAQIQDELRSQYLVAYAPTNKKLDGSYRKIQIDVANPELSKQKLRLTYRDGYFAENTTEQLDKRRLKP